jgi:hypothetical protein
MTGVQSSNIRESSKFSAPLRFQYRSNLEIPTIIFSAFFIMTTSYLLLILKCKFSKIKQEMFTGIIETLGTIKEIRKEKRQPSHHSGLDNNTELQIDQSVAHNGICLTVVSLADTSYTVTAIDETIKKTNLGNWKLATGINLEKSK